MWVALPISLRRCLPLIIIPKTNPQPERRFAVTVSATSQNDAAEDNIGGLGHAVLTAFKSNSEPVVNPKTSNPKPKHQKHQKQKQKQKQEEEEEEEEGRQLRGSDVLWALQRATAQKNKISGGKKKKRGFTSVGSTDKGGIYEEDYSNVRPLCIKPDWASRLNELEIRLQELSDT